MDVDFTKAFSKQFSKLPCKKQQQAKDAVELFLQDIASPNLRNHGLKKEWPGFRSIGAGGGLILHCRAIAEDRVPFVAIGSYS